MPKYRFTYDPVRHPNQPPSDWIVGSDTVDKLQGVGTTDIEAKEVATNLFVAEVQFEVAAADANISVSVRVNTSVAVLFKGVSFVVNRSSTAVPLESTNMGVRCLPHAGFGEVMVFVPDRPVAGQWREHLWSFTGNLPGLKLGVRAKKLG